MLSLPIHIFAVRSFLCFLFVLWLCVCVYDQDATWLRLFIAIVYCIHVLLKIESKPMSDAMVLDTLRPYVCACNRIDEIDKRHTQCTK